MPHPDFPPPASSTTRTHTSARTHTQARTHAHSKNSVLSNEVLHCWLRSTQQLLTTSQNNTFDIQSLTCSTTSAEGWVCQNELYMEGLWTNAFSNYTNPRKKFKIRTVHWQILMITMITCWVLRRLTLSLAHWMVCSMTEGKDLRVQNGISSSGGSLW